MNYNDTLDWMFAQLPMYQNQGKTAFKKDLTNSLELSKHLENPHNKFKSIHVAGTNGKGSTSHILASVLQESGLKVGLYTSPHLKDFRERIKVNGTVVSEEFVVEFIKRNMAFFEEHQLSFFEMTVGMAFDYFAKSEVDIGVIEVGLGGRLDSTNIIKPLISVITNIGYDHMQFLGETLQEIATEKAGIIKPEVPVVIGESNKETEKVFSTFAAKNNAEILFADSIEVKERDFSTDLKGHYQKNNVRTSLVVINLLNKLGYKINLNSVNDGLENVVANTKLLGRWQILRKEPKVICDVAHNVEGLSLVMEQLKEEEYDHLHIVVGFVNDKKLEKIVNLFPKNATYYYCAAKVQRALKVDKVEDIFSENGFVGNPYSSVENAYREAIFNAEDRDLIYVGGSTFVVAEVL